MKDLINNNKKVTLILLVALTIVIIGLIGLSFSSISIKDNNDKELEGDPFVMKVDTTNKGITDDNEFIVQTNPFKSNLNQSKKEYSIKWTEVDGDNSGEIRNINADSKKIHFESAGTYKIEIY